jgi:hypothetical protein
MFKKFALIAFTVTTFSGCASIVTGSNQSLSVEAAAPNGENVVGANCKLVNDKGNWFINTPGTVTVQRSYNDLNVSCTKDGHGPGITTVKSSTKAMAAGNIIFGGPIGAGVDAATGAAFDYPSLIKVLMDEKKK